MRQEPSVLQGSNLEMVDRGLLDGLCFIENFGALVGTTNVHHAIKPFLLVASHTLFHLMVHIQDK